MPDLTIGVSGAGTLVDSLMPMISLNLEISNRFVEEKVHSILLRCQIQIETPRRSYSPREQEKLHDLFGEPERWSQTLKPILWSNVSIVVPAFSGAISVSLPVPCPLDLNAASVKYFYGLESGSIPLTLLFSGTVFYQSSANQLQASPISWGSEARFPFPVALWKECIDLHYPNSAWLSVRRDLLERLYEFKVREGFATFDEALEQMLKCAQAGSRMGRNFEERRVQAASGVERSA